MTALCFPPPPSCLWSKRLEVGSYNSQVSVEPCLHYDVTGIGTKYPLGFFGYVNVAIGFA